MILYTTATIAKKLNLSNTRIRQIIEREKIEPYLQIQTLNGRVASYSEDEFAAIKKALGR